MFLVGIIPYALIIDIIPFEITANAYIQCYFSIILKVLFSSVLIRPYVRTNMRVKRQLLVRLTFIRNNKRMSEINFIAAPIWE